RAGFELQGFVQGVELEEVSVRLARGWAGPAIAQPAEIVLALLGSSGHVLAFVQILGEFSRRGRQVIQHPMHPRAYRRVWIISDEDQTLGACGNTAPFKRRREVFLIASMPGRDGRPVGKCSAGQLHVVLRWSFCRTRTYCKHSSGETPN